MDYAKQAEYNNFLLRSMMEESDMQRCIQEAIILSEGYNVGPQMEYLTEGVGDKLKEIWAKFTAFIKRIFGKFKEVMNKVFDTDKGWLEQYKDIIIKKPFKLEDVKCRDYQLDRIAAVTVELFNYSQIKDRLIGGDGKPSKSRYMHSYFNTFSESENADDLGGWLKAYFCNGTEEEKELSKFNMTDLYNFCHDFKEKTMPKLEQDERNIEKSATNANSLIVSAVNTANETQQKAAAAEPSDQTGTTNTPKKEGTSESVGFSKLLGRVLNEVEFKKPDGQQSTTANATSNPTGTDAKKFSNNAPGTSGEGETAASAANVAANNDLTDEKVRDIINTYSAVASAIAGAKLTVTEWAYKDYMKLLRAHVQMYVGNEGAAPNKIADGASNYTPPVGAPANPTDGQEHVDPNGKKWTFGQKVGKWLQATGDKLANGKK